MDDSSSYHVVLFPYMSKGHTIPLLQFAHLLIRHRHGGSGGEKPITVTIFTTPKNEPFITNSLSDTPIKVISLPFSDNITGVESTDKLPSMSLYVPFTRATKLLQPFFEDSLLKLPRVSFIISDGFLWWTSESASKFKIPRFVFYGMNCYSTALTTSVVKNKLFSQIEPGNNHTKPVTIPDFPWIKVRKSDFEPVFTDPNPLSPEFELLMDQMKSTRTSLGIITNTFYELEPRFVDYHNGMGGPKSLCVGPFCFIEPGLKPAYDGTEEDKPVWIRWLDRKLEEGRPVLYVAFGTQAEISNEQFKEIALGLEDSEVNFLWVTRKNAEEEFEEIVKERGMIITEWVNQKEILQHDIVKGFLSHCGWNSVLESISALVPIIAWPMMGDQPLNAKMVVEELEIGVRVETNDGTTKGFVSKEELTKKIKELIEGESGKIAKKRVKEYAEMAKKAMEEGIGSSWKNLDILLDHLC